MRSSPFSFALRKESRASRHGRAPASRRFRAPRGRRSSASTILRTIAAAILISGWLTAAVVLVQASETHDAGAVEYQIVGSHVYPITLAESKHDKLVVQQMGGDLGVWIAEFDAWLGSLLRSPRLAWTVLVLSTAIGVGCLRFATLSGETVDERSGGEP